MQADVAGPHGAHRSALRQGPDRHRLGRLRRRRTSPALINTYPNRISSFHVKDVVNPQPSSGTSSLRALGDGDINFAPIFVAAKNRVK